jgi:hypothetical protein
VILIGLGARRTHGAKHPAIRNCEPFGIIEWCL